MRVIDRRNEGPQELRLSVGDTVVVEKEEDNQERPFLVIKAELKVDQVCFILVDLDKSKGIEFDNLDEARDWLCGN